MRSATISPQAAADVVEPVHRAVHRVAEVVVDVDDEVAVEPGDARARRGRCTRARRRRRPAPSTRSVDSMRSTAGKRAIGRRHRVAQHDRDLLAQRVRAPAPAPATSRPRRRPGRACEVRTNDCARARSPRRPSASRSRSPSRSVAVVFAGSAAGAARLGLAGVGRGAVAPRRGRAGCVRCGPGVRRPAIELEAQFRHAAQAHAGCRSGGAGTAWRVRARAAVSRSRLVVADESCSRRGPAAGPARP